MDYALSREMNNKSGGKMYIQDKMEEYADELFDLLDNGADIYFCGLKGAHLPPARAGAVYSTVGSCSMVVVRHCVPPVCAHVQLLV